MTLVPTNLNIDWSGLVLESPRDRTAGGRNGKAIEQYMRSLGWRVDPHGTIDLPDIGPNGVEIKSRGIYSTVPYSIGCMTETAIKNCPWDNTSVKRKIQIQYRVMVGEDEATSFGCVVDSFILDFRHRQIQSLLRESYEKARHNLINHSKAGTAAGGRYGFLEYKNGNNYSFRITRKGMENLVSSIPKLKHDLFEFA